MRIDVLNEAINLIDPIIELLSIFFVRGIVWLTRTARETIGTMKDPRDMDELEVEHPNSNDPAIHTSVRGEVGIIEHPFNRSTVHFDN
jgi:hypothetical protein